MSDQKTIVNEEPVSAAPAKPDEALDTGKAIADYLMGREPEATGVAVEKEAVPTAGEQALNGVVVVEQTETPETKEEATGQPNDEVPAEETETEVEAEPEGGTVPKARFQEVIAKKNETKAKLEAAEKLLAEKEARLIALGDSPQPPTRPTSEAPPRQEVSQPSAEVGEPEFSSVEWRGYLKHISDQREAGQAIPDAQLEEAQQQLHRAIVREEIRAEGRKAQQVNVVKAQRAQTIKSAIELESIDPQFAILDGNGVVVQSPFTKQVVAETVAKARNLGIKVDDAMLMTVAHSVALRVQSGKLQFARSEAKQETTKSQQTLKQTGMTAPSHTRMTTVKSGQASTPWQKYEALIKRAEAGDEAARSQAIAMETSGVLNQRR
jgi:hypothetical protein